MDGIKQKALVWISIAVIVGAFPMLGIGAEERIFLSQEEYGWIGEKIFENECGGKNENLVAWNDGEEFMSLGIGHFIWYPKDWNGPFDESFPKYLDFIKREDVGVPDWLNGQGTPCCPWARREEFLRNLNDPKMSDLKKLMIETKDLQIHFIVERLKSALPKMIETVPDESKSHVEQQFYRVVSTSAGVYALIDYVNFCGEGTLITERYKGQGWGLLQVLERMKGIENSMTPAVEEFAQAAEEILTERVNNSPPARNEQRFLPGWKTRVNTYGETQ
ncbi:MAG TPA: hypothetical protein PKY78_06860 [Candidatus Omnitrophota bacterium]|nr:hypothetical protein [Candidatus Omnitrophota bacterium]